MNDVERFLLTMERKKRALIRSLYKKHRTYDRCSDIVINRKMVQKRGEKTYEECMEVEMTKTQQDVFFFVDEFWKKYGMGPTMREITKFRGSKSLGSTHEIVDRLIRLGVLKKVKGMDRSVRPVYINFRDLDSEVDYEKT